MSRTDDPMAYFSLETQTVDALELLLDSLRRVPEREASWKWSLIGMHAALQGCFCLALEGTDGAQVLVPNQERQYREHVHRERESGHPEPFEYTTSTGKSVDEMVDWFMELFKKVQNPERMSYFAGIPLQPTAEQLASVEWLDLWRGRFSHFGSGSIGLYIKHALGHLRNGIDIVDILLTQTQHASPEVSGGPIDTLTNPDLADRARLLITQIRLELDRVRDRYSLSC